MRVSTLAPLALVAFCLAALPGCAEVDSTPVRRDARSGDATRTDVPSGNNGMDGNGGGFDVPTPPNGGNDSGRVRINPDAFFAEDPPPMLCTADGGRYVTDVGFDPTLADPRCPPDKNREGCPCARDGMMGACWTGLRVNRNRGICRDGVTTCTGNEFPVWGPCVGAVLPSPGVMRGPGACNCFSEGTWTIPNISPCFIFSDAGRTRVIAASSSIDQGGGMISCGAARMGNPPYPPPGPIWSTDTLRVDCGGTFRLCYKLKAYDAPADAMGMMVRPSNCTLSQSCVTATVTAPPMGMMPMEQTLMPLPGWATQNAAEVGCAQRFVDNGGYGEMTVEGISSECQEFHDMMGGPLVFNRVNYCPSSCSRPMPPAECAMCRNGASGGF